MQAQQRNRRRHMELRLADVMAVMLHLVHLGIERQQLLAVLRGHRIARLVEVGDDVCARQCILGRRVERIGQDRLHELVLAHLDRIGHAAEQPVRHEGEDEDDRGRRHDQRGGRAATESHLESPFRPCPRPLTTLGVQSSRLANRDQRSKLVRLMNSRAAISARREMGWLRVLARRWVGGRQCRANTYLYVFARSPRCLISVWIFPPFWPRNELNWSRSSSASQMPATEKSLTTNFPSVPETRKSTSSGWLPE